MKRIFLAILSGLIACSTIQALDLHTDAACKPLKSVIERAQPLEKIQATWQKTVDTAQISAADQQELTTQSLAYAQEQKTACEAALTALGDKTTDSSKLKWAAAQLGLTAYFVTGVSLVLTGNKIHDSRGMRALWLPTVLAQILIENPASAASSATPVAWICLFEFSAKICLSPYLLYRGLTNLYQGLNPKKILEQKITNLDATIRFLHEHDAQTKPATN